MNQLEFRSSYDGTMQKCLFHAASKKGCPLLVGLHSWSFDMERLKGPLLPHVIEQDWNLLLPDFRGPNKATNPQHKAACGSEAAVQDIIDATEYIMANYCVDKDKIFLFGGSGGGHAALMAQAKAPVLWSKTISYVPVLDLKMWLKENKAKGSGYANDIVACVGSLEENEKDYEQRSPMYHIEEISKANHLKIYVGKFDHVINVEQGITFFNKIMQLNPSSQVFFDFFDGGHIINYKQVISYLKGEEAAGMQAMSR